MYCLNFCFLCFKEVTAVHIQCWRTPSWLQLIGRQCVPRLLSEASVSVMTMSMTVSCSMCTSFPYEDISRDLFGSGGIQTNHTETKGEIRALHWNEEEKIRESAKHGK